MLWLATCVRVIVTLTLCTSSSSQCTHVPTAASIRLCLQYMSSRGWLSYADSQHKWCQNLRNSNWSWGVFNNMGIIFEGSSDRMSLISHIGIILSWKCHHISEMCSSKHILSVFSSWNISPWWEFLKLYGTYNPVSLQCTPEIWIDSSWTDWTLHAWLNCMEATCGMLLNPVHN